ncbi:NAD-dependent epimerase/dehydratase family protein [Streptomyces clavuligerus]|nr:NAD-dependent epimerase/dehydratase family protein [Streptomyces clavuligerus]MBY6302519.1 NAD-dependent epimerase/dehydratase family protein [Streptomyces clavuligerus]QCS09233.1 epimerase [Streptomyces clavuligerus]QPJ96830.1 NAD-dependent epimerase/dehydratase family protein [Streptomyces clavuligerus]QPL66473.1 NAD-dependent epimerase/dehydratase family protein [Streptomyces clavuligerus]
MPSELSRRRSLITGGAGFIGGNLARRLTESGCDVTVVDDLRVPPMIPPEGTGKFLEKSILELHEDDLSNVGTVYHLASHKSVPRSFKEPLEYLDNVDSGRHLLRLCAKAGVPRVVIGSTCEVYGRADLLPTPETSPLAPLSPYAASKVALEMLARAHQKAPGAPEIGIVRFFNVYGPGERPDALVPRLCANLLLNGELPVEGAGSQRRDFSYITDVVDKLIALAGGPLPPVLNLGSGISFSVNEVVALLQRISPGARVARRPNRVNEIMEFRADTTQQNLRIAPSPDTVGMEKGTELTLAWWQSRDADDIHQRVLHEESH